ncbi:MAG: hypothetical protein WD737_07305 [Gemmatimonadota bacterium]
MATVIEQKTRPAAGAPTSWVANGAAMAAFLAAGIGAFAMGMIAFLAAGDVLPVPTLYGPAGGVSGRTTLAVVVWLIAWGILHFRWKDRQLAGRRIEMATLLLIALGVLGTFPPVWELL